MSPFPHTNALGARPGDPMTIGGGYPVTTTSRPSDRNIEPLHRRLQYNTNPQPFPLPLPAEIQENLADVPMPAMPHFSKVQSPSISDSAPNTIERRLITPTNTSTQPECGIPYSTSGNLEMNGVEHRVASPLQTPSAGDDSAVHTAQMNSAIPSQVPAQQTTLASCDECLKGRILCTGGQLNVKWCDACRNVKQSCSLHPRKYACQHCENVFMTPADVTRHKTKSHKKLIPKTPKRSSKRLRKDSETSPKPPTQPNVAVPHVEIDLTHELSNPVQQEMPHPDGLYRPDSPAYGPARERLDEIPDSPLSQSLDIVSQLPPPDQLRATSRRHPADIYIQFSDRVMDDNHVERSLRAIRKEIKNYEEFIRCKDPRHTSAEAEDQFNFLKTTRPFVLMRDVQEESHDFFASQPSRLVVLWRSMLEVHPTASLRDELIRYDLEGLELPVVICGTLAYALLRIIFDEPDQLRAAERTARFRSVKELRGVKFAAESIKHDELFIHKDRSVDREFKKSARELSERQFYDLLQPLTHWDLANPTTQKKNEHLRYLSDVALKSLRLSRELQARMTEDYSYFWPRPGELFNHIEAEDDQAIQGSQSDRIVRWTLMFGVKVNRGEHEMVYAKAVVMTMEA